MGSSKRRRADRARRPPMRSPGRPPVARREHRQRFWEAIARGLSSEEAGAVAGVSPAVGTRWFREGGGMPSVSPSPLSGRYLSFVEREEIAILQARDCGVREIAQRLGRSPSTISRELRRNAATRGGGLENSHTPPLPLAVFRPRSVPHHLPQVPLSPAKSTRRSGIGIGRPCRIMTGGRKRVSWTML